MIASPYQVGRADVEGDQERFVAEPSATVGTPAGTPTGPYEAMRLERHTDLADLILLDPVQDVSGAPWPRQ